MLAERAKLAVEPTCAVAVAKHVHCQRRQPQERAGATERARPRAHSRQEVGMTVKEKLHGIVDALGKQEAAELLDYAEWQQREGETLTEEDIARVQAGEAELARGERVSWEDLRRELNL